MKPNPHRFTGPCGYYVLTSAKIDTLRALVLAGDKGCGGSQATPGALMAFLTQHGLAERAERDELGPRWRVTARGRAVHHGVMG